MNRRSRHIICVISTALISSLPAAGDTAPLQVPRTGADAVSLPSVEVSSLARHIDHPINYCSGMLSVSYPLYTIEYGEVTLPITINATTGALKTEDEEGPLGLGWDLDYGGYVSRLIAGRPDDGFTADNIQDARNGDFYTLMQVWNGNLDAAYDRFQWKAGSYSGTFILNEDEEAIQLPATDASIETLESGFRITLPDGTVYEYGQPEYVSYHYSPSESDIYGWTGDYNEPCMWRLLSVTGPTGTDTITFSYANAPERSKSYGSNTSSISLSAFVSAQRGQTPGQLSGDRPSTMTAGHHYRYTARKVLSSVTWGGGSLQFISSSGLINTMLVKTHTGSEVLRVNFSYNQTTKRKTAANPAKRLTAYTVISGEEIVDGAEFTYHGSSGCTRDMFGYNNHGGTSSSALLHISELKLLDRNGDFYTGLSTDYIFGIGASGEPFTGYHTPPDSVFLVSPRESILAISADGLVPNPARSPYASQNDGVYSGALHSIRTLGGTETAIEYEPAWYRDSVYSDREFIGLRVRSVTVTDLATGEWRRHSLHYSGAVTTVPIDFSNLDRLVSVSGSFTATPQNWGGRTITTGVSLLSSDRSPGASMDNATVMYACVSDTLMGTGLGRGIVTTYEYDLSEAVCSTQTVPGTVITPLDDYKYAGTFISEAEGYTCPFNPAIRQLVTPKTCRSYSREEFGERVALKKVIQWRWRNNALDTLSVTENKYRLWDESFPVLSYYCESLVRTERTGGGDFGPGPQSTADFFRYEVKGRSARQFLMSTVTREYDQSGVCHKTETRYDYHCLSHNVSFPPPADYISSPAGNNGLLCRITTESGGDKFEQTMAYASSSCVSGIPDTIMNRCPALPVSTTYRHGTLTATQRNIYAYYGDKYRLSSQVTSFNGTTVDSVAITSYDSNGNPLGASRNCDTPALYTWDGQHHLTSSSTSHLTTQYSHIPLVGCSEIFSPAGTSTKYYYTGIRLASEEVEIPGNTCTLATYGYLLPKEGELGHVSIWRPSTMTGGAGITETRYLDGFGNTRVSAVTPTGGVGTYGTAASFDALGRPIRTYCPEPVSQPESWAAVMAEVGSYYHGDTRPYSLNGYAYSADSRPVSTTIPGQEYSAHPTTMEYRFNQGTTGKYACRKYTATYTSLKLQGYYPTGALSVSRTVDGDGRESLTFTDWRGRTVLTRGCLVQNSSTVYVDTYYVYDDADNLVMVLPPEATRKFKTNGMTWQTSSQSVLRDSVYRYSYDSRMFLREKKAPGAGAVKYWYDTTGACILTQDAVQAQRGVATFALTDSCGRSAVTGECLYTEALAASVQSSIIRARRDASGTLCGYSTSLSMTGITVFTANYYDDYSFLDLNLFTTLSQKAAAANVSPTRQSSMGLLTGTYARLLGEALQATGVNTQIPHPTSENYTLSHGGILDCVRTACYYDWMERPSCTVEYDHTGGLTVSRTQYASPQLAESVEVQRTPYSGTAQSVKYSYTYDTFMRKATVKMSRNGGTPFTVQIYSYDAVGRLVTRSYGIGRRVDMTYTTSGALSTIRAGSQSSATFTQTLLHATGNTPNYSGGIGSCLWTGADGVNRCYRYTYDGLNRLVSATYSESGTRPSGVAVAQGNTPNYTCTYTYGLDSSPLKITRQGVTGIVGTSSGCTLEFGMVDDLRFTTAGETLKKVYDAAADIVYTGASDFNDGADTATEYIYDAAGNMTSDSNRGVTSIAYNAIGLPYKVTFSDGSMLTSRYDATGRLMRRTVQTPRFPNIQPMPGQTQTYTTNNEDRIGTMTFRNGTLSRIDTEGAYWSPEGMRYLITDYIGSVRQVTDSVGTVLQDNHYYPYGMLMGESSDILAANRTGSWADAASNPFRFGGNELLTLRNAHLCDFVARIYDPATGRFMTPDIYREKFTPLNSYLYCGGNPIVLKDPNGEWLETVLDVLVLTYDVAAAGYYHVTGNHQKAKEHWGDAALDLVAVAIPCVPAGLNKVAKGGAKLLDSATDGAKVAQRGTKTAEKGVSSSKTAGKKSNENFQKNVKRGRENEQKTLEMEGLTKNTKKLHDKNTGVNTIPDAVTDNAIIEIKDTKSVYLTDQIKAQQNIARDQGKQHILYVGPNTYVCPTVKKGSTVEIRAHLGPK